MTRTLFYAACVCFLLSGCATRMPATERALQGQWFFAHQRSVLLGPPTFDSIEFIDSTRVKLRSTPRKWAFDGTYVVSDDQMSFEFHPPDVDKPIAHELGYWLSDSARTLILTYGDREWTYYRPNRFYKGDLTGKWHSSEGVLQLGEDGSCKEENDAVTVLGCYRLWRSRDGRAMMTMIRFVPNHGWFFTLWTVTKDDNILTLTCQGPLGEETVTWQRKED